jgi:hypothetical protein
MLSRHALALHALAYALASRLPCQCLENVFSMHCTASCSCSCSCSCCSCGYYSNSEDVYLKAGLASKL